jgi:hypothetical protein
LTIYTDFGTMYCCRPVSWHRSAAVSVHCTKSCIYSQKMLWGWANLSPETCRTELKRLINEKFLHLVGYLQRCEKFSNTRLAVDHTNEADARQSQQAGSGRVNPVNQAVSSAGSFCRFPSLHQRRD